jgi:hypothetical protein
MQYLLRKKRVGIRATRKLYFGSGIKHEVLCNIGLIISNPQFIFRIALFFFSFKFLNFIFDDV